VAVLRFSGYTFREGNPVGGIRVRAYPVLSGGGIGSSYVESSSQTGTGYWEVVVDTDILPSETGRYDIELYDPLTGQVRWVRSGLRFQVVELFGPGGVAPVPDQSVVASKIRDGAVADAKIGARTVDDATTVAYANSGTITQILSWFAKRLREILGTSTWRENVPISLAQLANHATRHRSDGPDPITPADIGAAPASHTHPTATPTSDGFMSAADKAKLDSITGGPGGGGLAFRYIRAAGQDIAATTTEDRITLIAGSGINLVPDPVAKTLTISVRQGPGSGLDADTVDGRHASDLTGSGGGSSTPPSITSYSNYYLSYEGSGLALTQSWQTVTSVSVPAGTYLVVAACNLAWNGIAGRSAEIGLRYGGSLHSYVVQRRSQVTDTYGAQNDMDSVSGVWIVSMGGSGYLELVSRYVGSALTTGQRIEAFRGYIAAVKLA